MHSLDLSNTHGYSTSPSAVKKGGAHGTFESRPVLAQDLVTYKNEVYVKEEEAKSAPLPGSFVAFSVNGTPQGVAYRQAALFQLS